MSEKDSHEECLVTTTAIGKSVVDAVSVTSPIHNVFCMQGSCANSPHPPLCESFRCGVGGNFVPALIHLWR